MLRTQIREHTGERGTVARSVTPLTVNRGQIWKCLCLPAEQPPVAGSSRKRFGGWDEGKGWHHWVCREAGVVGCQQLHLTLRSHRAGSREGASAPPPFHKASRLGPHTSENSESREFTGWLRKARGSTCRECGGSVFLCPSCGGHFDTLPPGAPADAYWTHPLFPTR